MTTVDESNEILLIGELRRDEGVRYEPYNDTMGIPTVGVGQNLKAAPLPDVWSYPLTDDQVDNLLKQDLQVVYKGLTDNLPWWLFLDAVRQRVLANMCFNMGIGKLLTFQNTLGFVKNGQFKQAADGMANSVWAKQVGERAVRLENMMRTGEVV